MYTFAELIQDKVSVPLRGKGRDQQAFGSLAAKLGIVQFPSPCGEKVGINTGNVVWVYHNNKEFPSPCGEKVGINPRARRVTSCPSILFPSPCGEKVGINALGGG